jgi:hypothetical protein
MDYNLIRGESRINSGFGGKSSIKGGIINRPIKLKLAAYYILLIKLKRNYLKK